jgi:hypothetical protein
VLGLNSSMLRVDRGHHRAAAPCILLQLALCCPAMHLLPHTSPSHVPSRAGRVALLVDRNARNTNRNCSR